MRCKTAKIMLSAHFDGELSPGQLSALGRHLSACASCAKEKSELSALHDTMSLWADEEPTGLLAESFAGRLGEFPERGQAIDLRRRSRWVFGTAAAGLATALLAIGLLLRSQVWQPATEGIVGPPAITESQPALPGTAIEGATPSSKPAPLETKSAAVVKARPARRQTGGPAPYTRRPAGTVSSGAVPMSGPDLMVSEKTGAPGAVAIKVTDSLGEAGLAMNETAERVRGNLQRTVDLLISRPPAPADDGMDSNGGNTL